MGFRFRYLGPEGSEVDVQSLDGLRALIESGTVGDLTFLYDVLTGEWAPARSHAAFRLLREEDSEGEGKLPDLGLTVSFQASATEPDTERAISSLLREREEDASRPQGIDSFALPSAWTSASLAPPPEVASPPGASTPSARPVRAPSDPAGYVPNLDRVVHRNRRQRGLHSVAERIRRIWGHRRLLPSSILAGSVGLLLLLVVAVGQPSETAYVSDASGPEVASAAMVATPDLSRLVARFALAKASGFRSMVAGMDSLRRTHDVIDVPPVWLEGVYLSDAARYREVERFWIRYQGFLQDVQASDTALFRGGFVRAVAGKDLSDVLLSMRLSRALREFKETQPERDALYSAMEELASAALALRALLVERADDIDYDPAIQVGISREPVVEAVAEDTVLGDRMWALLERIFASLDELGGDLGGSRDNLTDLLLQRVEESSR